MNLLKNNLPKGKKEDIENLNSPISIKWIELQMKIMQYIHFGDDSGKTYEDPLES